MKKNLLTIIGLAALMVGFNFIMVGCDAIGPSETTTTVKTTTTTIISTSTTSTTSTTIDPIVSSLGDSIGKSASLANSTILGMSAVGTTVGNICGFAGNPTQEAAASAVNAFTTPVAPPESFFAHRDASWNGYLTAESIHIGEIVLLQFSTFGGDIINGSIFSSPSTKEIALVSGIDWDDLLKGLSTAELNSIVIWGIVPPQTYQAIDSMWDYILWSSVLPKVRQAFIDQGAPESIAEFTNPVSTIPDDMLGSFQGTVTRDASSSNYGVNITFVGSMEFDTSLTPSHEVPKTLTGEGTVTLPGGTAIDISNIDLGFQTDVLGGVIPGTGSFDWSFVMSAETWSGTCTLNGAERTATGTISKNGSPEGTLYLDALGGAIVTIEGQTIFVTAPL